MNPFVVFVAIVVLIWFILPDTEEADSPSGSVDNVRKHAKKARSISRTSRVVNGIFLALGLLGSIGIGWFFTNLTNNWDYLFYGIGISVGVFVIHHLVKNIILISENTYMNNMLQQDLIEIQNKNSVLLEILLSEKDTQNELVQSSGGEVSLGESGADFVSAPVSEDTNGNTTVTTE